MTQTQSQKSGTDETNDLGQAGVEQGSSKVIQELVRNQELMDSRVEFKDDLNLAMEQVQANVEIDRALGNFERFTINSLNGAIEAVKAKYEVSSLQARRLLAQTDAVKKNRKLALFLKQDIDRAEAFTRIKASFEKIIFHHLSTIVTNITVGFANSLEKVANIDETLKNRKLKKQVEKSTKEKHLQIWSKWEEEVKSAIEKISLKDFRVRLNLQVKESVLVKTADLPATYDKQFIDSKKGALFIKRTKGPLEKYVANLESGVNIEFSVGNFKQKTKRNNNEPENLVEAQLKIVLPPDCIIVYYNWITGKTSYSTFNSSPSPSEVIRNLDADTDTYRYFILKLEESNGSLNSKVIESFDVDVPDPRHDYWR